MGQAVKSVGLGGNIASEPASRLPVSVIIPAHNAAATLARAVESVLAQTRAPMELIIVDDASTDSTTEVVQALCAQHPTEPIKMLRLADNIGPGSARNAGWRLATGEFIAFLDADDAWHPRKLEIQYSWLSAHSDIALCGHRCVVRDEGDLVPVLEAASPTVRRFGLRSFLVANRLSTPTVMVRRAIPNRFREGKRYSEDYLLWMEIVAIHGPAAFIDLPLAFLFKARYGATGLSAQHGAMRLGEIDTFDQLRQAHIIGWPEWALVSTWAWLKFGSRMVGQAAGLPHQ
jgi:glycosyltransferase involved in cell wall biosynthesis